MDLQAVQSSYARWARIYDRTFGVVTRGGRRRAVEYINATAGRVLEVGVGTGLSLELYRPGIEIVGIDFSEEMLKRARSKAERMALRHVTELRRMDARYLDYPDGHFDTVAAMHVLSVVPEPELVMAEIARVCKPGGHVVITNHFMRTEGPLAALERLTAPLTNLLGWHPDFPLDTVLGQAELTVVCQGPLPPFGMMTFLVLRKDPPP